MSKLLFNSLNKLESSRYYNQFQKSNQRIGMTIIRNVEMNLQRGLKMGCFQNGGRL